MWGKSAIVARDPDVIRSNPRGKQFRRHPADLMPIRPTSNRGFRRRRSMLRFSSKRKA
ncbi:hypothetical protein CISG_05168 [Coccidioides immitis RMSCC 3703]|uniref:Uncharacterized protein n=1 Tax=Coccidioides immitis RMSCC 3703 TaxID=454286 RepID=A0A0J8QTI6_COCIT|nr:hypothetical protein CISG_05168 [Coccidioides immitis RMSCC 3703]